MTKLTKTEIRWLISALEHTADDYKTGADQLTGVLQGIALQAEGNNRATAKKLDALLDTGKKRIAII